VRVPLDGAEHTELVAFRADDGAPENFAILVKRPPTPGPVAGAAAFGMLHPAIFWARSNGDCGQQLRGAVENHFPRPAAASCFILRKEGRGKSA